MVFSMTLLDKQTKKQTNANIVFDDVFKYKELNEYLIQWESQYMSSLAEIDLFKIEVSENFTKKQIEFFVRTFYHVRGHFYKFLWCLGNNAPTKKAKKLVLDNFNEEFSEDNPSHETLYQIFAHSINPKIDIAEEFIKEEYYFDFIREYNTEHIRMLLAHPWSYKISAFSAYERLDNTDYSSLLKMVDSFNLNASINTIFFKIHANAKHFDMLYCDLTKVWIEEKDSMKEAFTFIAEHQLSMWKLLSNSILSQ